MRKSVTIMSAGSLEWRAKALCPLPVGIGASWERVSGIQLELSIQSIYDGQPDHLPLLAELAAQGLRPHLVIPGHWSRHYGRILEYDVVCFRD